ncbi:hypothetical protein D9615_008362 [Tricholomella constricta]|uniref:Uncharacterized protein n=1 Tax=Tricholomella constricta TaxID=117010 RepID=A0A8H5HDU9_9AGAR|nr:hypothetical protein D9615_008362 [Tricholomella constricta]
MRWFQQMDDKAQTRLTRTRTSAYVRSQDGNPDLNTVILCRAQATAAHCGASPGKSRQINSTRFKKFTRVASPKFSAHEAERRRLELEDRELNKAIIARAQKKPDRRLIPLAEDQAAQGLLARMREHSERIRRSRARNLSTTGDEAQAQWLRDEVENLRRENETFRRQPQTVYVPPPPARADTGTQRRLREEVENLRRENEIFRILQSQAASLDDAPPPYTRIS